MRAPADRGDRRQPTRLRRPCPRRADVEERCATVLNSALTEAFESRDDVYLLGEDVLDPYGGAFKVTQGLSSTWPQRVITTPVSEGAIFGVAAGMALRGWRPILEIMFGDFIALGFDQTVNGIAKFRAMFDDQVRVPLVIRTPMGGRRGYGPTHSQTLEKVLLGVPGHQGRRAQRVPRHRRAAARGDRRRRSRLLHREQAHVRTAEPQAGGRAARRSRLPGDRRVRIRRSPSRATASPAARRRSSRTEGCCRSCSRRRYG